MSAEPLPRSAAGGRNPWLVACVASIATFMEVLDTTVASVSLWHIAASMGVSYQEALWVITSYLVANALVLPMSGWLANWLGRKRYYMGSVALFTLASLLCSVAPSLEWLLVARVLQGIGGGGLAPVEQSMLVDSFNERSRPKAFALYGVTVLFAPAIGPLIGGLITDALSWHWVFLINVPVGLLSLILCHRFIDEPPLLREERQQRRARGVQLDWQGLLLVVAGFAALQLCLDRFERYDGFDSPFIITTALIALACLTFLPLWEWFHPAPIVDVRLFCHRNFSLGAALMFLVGLLVVSTTQLLPQMAQELLGYDAWTAGLTLGAGGFFILLSMMVTGALASRVRRPYWLIVLGLVISGLSLWHFASLTPQVDFATLMWARVFQMIGIPLILIPVASLSYVGLPPEKSSEASALSTLLRNLGGSIGIAWVANALHQRSHLHYARLSESASTGINPDTLGHAAWSQASFMSYMDIYWLLGAIWLALCWLPFLFHIRQSDLDRVYKSQPEEA